MDTLKSTILDALTNFANQRPGLEPGNYGSWRDYRRESRAITRDLHDYHTLRRAVVWRDSLSGETLAVAFQHAYCGRLSCEVEPVYTPGKANLIPGHVTGYRATLDYCTGQYFPTEYRKAACAVLASALWAHKRDHCMPAPDGADGCGSPTYGGLSGGDWLRGYFRREFGLRLARRWFDWGG